MGNDLINCSTNVYDIDFDYVSPPSLSNNVLITGVNGQAGSYLADLLLQKGYKVIGLKRRTSTNSLWRVEHNLKNKNFIVEEGDITDYGCMFSLIDKYRPCEIYNTAAQSHVKTSFSQPGLTWDITAKGVLNILEIVRHINYPVRFVQFSSSEMFGNSHDSGVQSDTTKFEPNSPYAVAKLAAYHLVKIYRKSYNIYATNVIFNNMESPRRGSEFVTKKIAEYVGKLKYNPSLPKLKLGNIYAKRDWGYCPEYMSILWRIMCELHSNDYLLATGEAHSVQEFLEEAFSLIGTNYKYHVEIDESLYRPNEVEYLRGDYTKVKEKFGWEPKVKFKDLVKIMVEHEIEKNASLYKT